MSSDTSLITAYAIRTCWLLRIWEFDAIEIHPCAVIAYDGACNEIVETCEPKDASFWTVYGHYRAGGVGAFEDFATEAQARTLHDQLTALFPHLSALEG